MNLVRGGAALSIDAPNGATIGVRPQHIRLVDAAEPADARGRVEVIEPLGREPSCHVRVAGIPEPLRVFAPPDAPLAEGREVGLRLDRDRVHRW